MSVSASSLVARASTPAGPGELWEPVEILRHNWSDAGFVLSSSFEDEVVQARTRAERRTGLSDRPSRGVRISNLSLDADQHPRMLAQLERMTLARSLAALWCDASIIEGFSGPNELLCDTARRRFHVGGRAVVVRDTGRATFDEFSIHTILAVAPDRLTLDGWAGGWSVGRVAPVLEVDASASIDVEAFSSHIAAASATLLETKGSSALPALEPIGATPAGMDEFEGAPVLRTRPDFAEVRLRVRREVSFEAVGIGDIAEGQGSRPAMAAELTFILPTRERAWDFLRFHDSRGGRLHPFWCASWTASLLAVDAPDASTIDVGIVGETLDQERREVIALITADGGFELARVDSIERVGGVDRLTLAAPISADPQDVVAVRWAYLCRFSSRSREEEWLTGDICVLRLDVEELIEEKAVEFDGPVLVAATPSPHAAWQADNCSRIPLPEGVYVTAPGKSGSGKDYELARFDPAAAEWHDYSDLVKKGRAASPSWVRAYYCPQYDRYSLYLVGNVAPAGDMDGVPKVCRLFVNPDTEDLAVEAVGGNWTAIHPNDVSPTSLDHFPDAMIPAYGTLWFVWTKYKGVGFQGVLEWYRLSGDTWVKHTTWDSGVDSVQRVNSLRRVPTNHLPAGVADAVGDSVYQCIGAFGQTHDMLYICDLSAQVSTLGPDVSVGADIYDGATRYEPGFQQLLGSNLSPGQRWAQSQAIVAGNWPAVDPAGNSRAGIARFFGLIGSGDPPSGDPPTGEATFAYFAAGGGHYRNAPAGAPGQDPIPLTGSVLSEGHWSGILRCTLEDHERIYVYGHVYHSTYGDSHNLYASAYAVSLPQTIDFTSPDPEDVADDPAGGGDFGSYDGGYAWIQERTWNESGFKANSLSNEWRTACRLDDVMYAVGQITDVSGLLGEDVGPDHRVRNPSISAGPGVTAWEPWVVRDTSGGAPWWTGWTTCYSCTAVASQTSRIDNWHDS